MWALKHVLFLTAISCHDAWCMKENKGLYYSNPPQSAKQQLNENP